MERNSFLSEIYTYSNTFISDLSLTLNVIIYWKIRKFSDSAIMMKDQITSLALETKYNVQLEVMQQ